MNKDFFLLSGTPFDSDIPWAVPVSSNYFLSDKMPAYLKRLNVVLFEKNPDRENVLYRTNLYISLIRSTRFSSFINVSSVPVPVAFPVITEDNPNNIAYSISGRPSESAEGRLKYDYDVYVGSGTLTIVDTGKNKTTLTPFAANTSFPLGSCGVSIKFPVTPETADPIRFSIVGKPVDVITKLNNSLENEIAAIMVDLFDGGELFNGFKSIYNNATNYIEKITAVLLAYIYKMSLLGD